jgi:hypothetical protein
MLSGVWSISLRVRPGAVHLTTSLSTFTSDAAAFGVYGLVNQVAAR